MVTIPERNFLKMAALSLVGSFAICGAAAYGAYRLADKFVFQKYFTKGES